MPHSQNLCSRLYVANFRAKTFELYIFWRKFGATTANLAEILVEEAVEKRIGTGAAHPTDVTGRVHNHSRLLLQPIRMFRESGPTNRNGGKPWFFVLYRRFKLPLGTKEKPKRGDTLSNLNILKINPPCCFDIVPAFNCVLC